MSKWLKRAKVLLLKLSPGDLKDLDRELHKTIELTKRIEAVEEVVFKDKQIPRERSVVYQQEYVKCGKEKCRCAEGQVHGPYWYAYYRSPRTGRVVSKYCGKEKKEIKPR